MGSTSRCLNAKTKIVLESIGLLSQSWAVRIISSLATLAFCALVPAVRGLLSGTARISMVSVLPWVERCSGVRYCLPTLSLSPSTQASPIGQPSLVTFPFAFLVRGGINTGPGRRQVAHRRGHVVDKGIDAGLDIGVVDPVIDTLLPVLALQWLQLVRS